MSIERIVVRYSKIPTQTPEMDGTLTWNSTGLVTVEVFDKNEVGLGYTYADKATALFLEEHLTSFLIGEKAHDHLLLLKRAKRLCRNMGNAGVASMAISALDIALWDLKARLLHVSLPDLLGKQRQEVPFYGSGLFINNSQDELKKQIELFEGVGLKKFKMKIGQGIQEDLSRMRMIKEILPREAILFVDANGYYQAKEALQLSTYLDDLNVQWFEEPITSDDTEGLKFLRQHFPASVPLVAGEYCYQVSDFLNLLQNHLVDIIQLDATRCEGVTGAMEAATLSQAYNIPLSTHCAPLLHGILGLSLKNLSVSECFYDHFLIEKELFDHLGEFSQGSYQIRENGRGFGWKLNSRIQEFLEYEHTTG